MRIFGLFCKARESFSESSKRLAEKSRNHLFGTKPVKSISLAEKLGRYILVVLVKHRALPVKDQLVG
jgi:hypothetical protein